MQLCGYIMEESGRFEILEAIESALEFNLDSQLDLSQDTVMDYIRKAAHMLGFQEPFDPEQRAINSLLLKARASKTECYSAWAYYYDRKMIEARKR